MTLYLLDANVLIRAHELYYPVDRIPAFWAWLLAQARANVVKMPRVIFDEITPRPGPFATWLAQRHVRETLILNENIPVRVIRHIIDIGDAPDVTDVDDAIGKDPFLVASALSGADRVVVTLEVSKPSKRRHRLSFLPSCRVMASTRRAYSPPGEITQRLMAIALSLDANR